MTPPPAGRGWTLAVLCMASAAWAFSFGLSVPLTSLWLQEAGYNGRIIGLNTSIYYLGVALASPFLPRLMALIGARNVVVLGMIVDGITVGLFPFVGGVPSWFLLRFLAGIGTAMSLIPMETHVNSNAPPTHRARDFGLYAVAVASGVGLGPGLGLPLFPVAPYLAFVLAGLASVLAAGLVHWGMAEWSDPTEVESPGAAPLAWRQNALSLGTAWVQGFLEGGMLTFLSTYLLGLGYTEAGASGLIGAMFVGIVAVQMPGAWLADRFGRLRVLLICHAVVLAGLLFLPGCREPLGLGMALFLVGACSAAVYPLGLALMGERLAPSGLARANAWYLTCNCAGSLVGPWLTGEVCDLLGPQAMFLTAATVVLVAAGGGLLVDSGPPEQIEPDTVVADRKAA